MMGSSCNVIFISLIFFAVFSINNVSSKSTTIINRHIEKPVTMTVFYETLCPDSMKFFTEQLSTLFKDETKLNRYVNFDLVPYGNAETKLNGNKWSFTCQHGPLECDYNKLHACVITALSYSNSNQDIERFIPFLICLMTTKNEDSVLNECATRYEIPVDGIKHCQLGKTADKLLAKYGSKTQRFRPSVQSVPTVVINGEYNETDQQLALTNLPKLICKYLQPKPSVCNLTSA